MHRSWPATIQPGDCSDRKRLMSLALEARTLELTRINADIGAGGIVVPLGSALRAGSIRLHVYSWTHAIAIGQGEHCRNHPHQWDVANHEQRPSIRSA